MGRIYEIINPSDPYTLEAEDFKDAAVAILMISPELGLEMVPRCAEEANQDAPSLPILAFGGMEKWIEDHICPMKDVKKFIDDRREAIAKVLESVLIGKPRERRIFEDAMEAIDDPKKREAFKAKWHDGKRSSLNDIGGAAWDLAKYLRKAHTVCEDKGEAKRG